MGADIVDELVVPEPEEQEIEQAPPPPPSFSEEEMALAKQTAYAEGLASGMKQAEQEMQHAELEAQKKLTQSCNILGKAMEQAQHEMNRQIADQQARQRRLTGGSGPDEPEQGPGRELE